MDSGHRPLQMFCIVMTYFEELFNNAKFLQSAALCR